MSNEKYRIVIGLLAIPVIALITLARCGSSSSGGASAGAGTTAYVYVASGNTYAGLGSTPPIGVNVIAKFNINGTLNSVIADYTENPGDVVAAMINYDSKRLMVGVENAINNGFRRIELVNKDGSGAAVWVNLSVAFAAAAAIVNDIALQPDGGVVIAKGIALATPSQAEKYSSTKTRIQFANIPFINNPQGTGAICANSNNRLQHVITGPGGNLIFSQPFLAQNRLIMVNATGYQVAGDCLAVTASPGANYYSTGMLMHSSGNLLVGYSNVAVNPEIASVYSYTPTTTAIGAGTIVYNNVATILGMTALAEKIDDKSVLVASGGSTAAPLYSINAIYQFTYNSTAQTFTQVGTQPLIAPSVYTRSVSAMVAPADGP